MLRVDERPVRRAHVGRLLRCIQRHHRLTRDATCIHARQICSRPARAIQSSPNFFVRKNCSSFVMLLVVLGSAMHQVMILLPRLMFVQLTRMSHKNRIFHFVHGSNGSSLDLCCKRDLKKVQKKFCLRIKRNASLRCVFQRVLQR